MADDPLPGDLTEEEERFLLNAVDAGILAYRPREDPMISGLSERGYLKSQPDEDQDYALLLLTPAGHTAAALIRAARG